jgi:hypothetical protein
MDSIIDAFHKKGDTRIFLTSEEKRIIENSLVDIKLSTDKMVEEKRNIEKRILEIKAILNK